jgi:hypothetical protein
MLRIPERQESKEKILATHIVIDISPLEEKKKPFPSREIYSEKEYLAD